MDKNKITAQLLEAGVTEEELGKIDFEKVGEIIDTSRSIDSLCKTLKSNYPDFNEAGFREALEKNTKDSEEMQDLSDNDLEAVAGGSVGSWISKNKELVTGIALLALCVPVGYFMHAKGKAAGEAKIKDAYNQGYHEGADRMEKLIPKLKVGQAEDHPNFNS